MEFFNRKQDVIEIVLTPHGRKLFISGNFKPTYYAFSDSSIIYDCRTMGFSGSQNEFIERMNEVPILKKSVFLTHNANDKRLPEENLNACLLGTSEFGQQKYPGFDLKLYSGRISGSIEYSTGSYINERIPKFNVEMQNIFDTNLKSFTFEESLFLELNEVNGIFEKENFEFKLFKLNEVDMRVGNLRIALFDSQQELEFKEPPKIEINVVDNLDSLYYEEIQYEPTDVEYWFEIAVDEKISDEIIFNLYDLENIYSRPENNQTGSRC